jgi:cold shock protein
MAVGIVKWFDIEKGFGFIKQENGNEVYVDFRHIIEDIKKLEEGQKVEFIIKNEFKILLAENVKVLDKK